MKIRQLIDNGNGEAYNKFGIISTVLINPESRDIDIINNLNSFLSYDIVTENSRSVANININNIKNVDGVETVVINNNNNNIDGCIDDLLEKNQSRINKEENSKNLFKLLQGDSINLADFKDFYASDGCLDNENPRKKILRENACEFLDNLSPRDRYVPRGIINPNYPGFQHFAHTLQDYTVPLDSLTYFENDMTENNHDIDKNDKEKITSLFNIANNNNNEYKIQNLNIINKNLRHDIPDILKTANGNNSIDSLYCDIENNFQTRDIIGDFNREIEEEIKQVLNYNINIQDDLNELKKEINDNLSKPIEKTINNISDVVNHVIKKLVKTQCQTIETGCSHRWKSNKESLESDKCGGNDDIKEMIRNQPSFFVFENNINAQIADAFLSDGKDELNVNEQDYDAEKVELSVENTLKQLSTELRKIIPKLGKLRESESLRSNQNELMFSDGNCNQVPCSSVTVELSDRHFDKAALGDRVKEIKDTSDSRGATYNPKESKVPSMTSGSKDSVPKSIEEDNIGSFDVYNIETALPKLDIDAIESHLMAAKEAERRKRNDREEIRKRLAMGGDNDEYYSLGHIDRPGRKPSLQSRLQSGMDLQICFMNETASDNESQISDMDRSVYSSNKSLSKSSIFSRSNYNLNNHPYQTRPLSVSISKQDKISTSQCGSKIKPSVLTVKSKSKSSSSLKMIQMKESDFYVLQSTLQTEARIALAQAKELARIQMERERRTRPVSPVTEMLRRSMQKANAPLASDRRRVSRHILTDMNIAQLQVIVNELHSQIEGLNESLVRLLMARDELHMSQDSMLVDIEDLTRYFGVKEQNKKSKGTSKSAVRKITSLVNK